MIDKHKVLVIDDEPKMQEFIQETLRRQNFEVSVAGMGRDAIENLNSDAFDLVITDVILPDINGLDILRKVQEMPNAPGVIVITAFGSVKNAVSAIKHGAYDYLTKPFAREELEIILEKYFHVKTLEKENSLLKETISNTKGLGGIIGRSPSMLNVFAQVEMVAASSSTVLIQGESGTGKELIARAIHGLSSRRDHPFIGMNCAAVPEALVESELFGHEKGAFTGAIEKKEGRFKAADRGTIFLDEITEMSIHLQAKLLRILQEREFEPLGSVKTESIDVRVIATTNRDLKAMVESGKFREDLFYRLNVVPIFVPPLRDRKEDIPYLVQHFIQKLCALTGRHIDEIDPAVFPILENYNWPGNVRQLENAVERAIVTSKGPRLEAAHFSFLKNEKDKSKTNDAPAFQDMKLCDVEKTMILQRLKQERGNRTRTAEALGISVRTLRNKLREYRGSGDIDEEFAQWVYER